tara:strand:- start:81 stop:461 length:381 start_codon:yes stop_codon:yes gene_type:complete
MPVKFQRFITRQNLRDNPDTLYVFGDNFIRSGMGGQAKEMRGEPNAIGLPTKKAPTYRTEDFLTDKDLLAVMSKSSDNIAILVDHLQKREIVVWPEDGIGTGRARLGPDSKILLYYKYILEFLQRI